MTRTKTHLVHISDPLHPRDWWTRRWAECSIIGAFDVNGETFHTIETDTRRFATTAPLKLMPAGEE
ncbi:MAG: hypothetical protein KKD44_26040 [Proteobacteria bacterium]|nr:hypothetical protein [Pseudomonadota bacterium]